MIQNKVNTWRQNQRKKKVFSYGEGGAVSAEDGPVKGSDAVPGPEVQVSSSIAKNFNQLAALLQLHGQSQRTL